MNHTNPQYWQWAQQQGQAPQRHIVPQEPYTSPSHTTAPIVLQNAPIVFVVNGQTGIRASEALEESCQGLLNANVPIQLPDNIQQKITFRIQVVGYPKFEKQKYIRNVADNTPINMLKLAKRAAEAVQDFLQEMARRNFVPPPGSVQFGTQPGALGMDDLYIDFLEQRSKGSFQPRISYWA